MNDHGGNNGLQAGKDLFKITVFKNLKIHSELLIDWQVSNHVNAFIRTNGVSLSLNCKTRPYVVHSITRVTISTQQNEISRNKPLPNREIVSKLEVIS